MMKTNISILCLLSASLVSSVERYTYRLLSPSTPPPPAQRHYQPRISRQLDIRDDSGPYLNRESFFSAGFLEDLFGLGRPAEPTVSFQGKNSPLPLSVLILYSVKVRGRSPQAVTRHSSPPSLSRSDLLLLLPSPHPLPTNPTLTIRPTTTNHHHNHNLYHNTITPSLQRKLQEKIIRQVMLNFKSFIFLINCTNCLLNFAFKRIDNFKYDYFLDMEILT